MIINVEQRYLGVYASPELHQFNHHAIVVEMPVAGRARHDICAGSKRFVILALRELASKGEWHDTK